MELLKEEEKVVVCVSIDVSGLLWSASCGTSQYEPWEITVEENWVVKLRLYEGMDKKLSRNATVTQWYTQTDLQKGL